MDSVPSKSEQIESVLHSRAYELTMKYAGRDQSGRPQYSKVFTVTRKDVEEYVKSHYHLDNLPFAWSSPGEEDGLYIIAKPVGYLVYHQERCIRTTEFLVPTEQDAWNFFIDHALNTSGTGLRWD